MGLFPVPPIGGAGDLTNVAGVVNFTLWYGLGGTGILLIKETDYGRGSVLLEGQVSK